MADDDSSPARPLGADDSPGVTPAGDVIDFGELKPVATTGPAGAPRPRPQWIRWLPIAVAACAAAAIVIHLTSTSGDPHALAKTSPIPSVAAPYPGGGSPPAGSPSDPVYYETPLPILGITNTWELFGFGSGRDGADPEVVRIQFGDGGVTRTSLPPLMSTGPVSFAAGMDWAVVRPLDAVPGYLVRSRTAAAALPPLLRNASSVIPGPGNDMWAAVEDDRNGRVHMILTNADGHAAGPRIELPETLAADPQSDRAGNVIVTGADGAYLASPSGLRRITAGTLLAAGPTRWLTLDCDDTYNCALNVVDRATNARHTLRGVSADSFAANVNRYGAVGDISPNGTYAIVAESEGRSVQSFHLLNLDTGADQQLRTPLDGAIGPGMMVFSPDSRWLFLTGGDGAVNAVDTTTGDARSIGINLPPIDRLAMIDAGS